MVFVDSFAGEGGSTAAAATRDSVANESRKKMGKMVWQGPRLGFVAETGRFVAMETPRVRFSCLLLCLASYFSFFVFLFFLSFFPASRYVYLLRVPSSVQQPSAALSKYVFIVRVLSACVICTLPHLGILFFIRVVFFFRRSYFSGGVFFVVLSYPVR